jgi:hypothetical protein
MTYFYIILSILNFSPVYLITDKSQVFPELQWSKMCFRKINIYSNILTSFSILKLHLNLLKYVHDQSITREGEQCALLLRVACMGLIKLEFIFTDITY